MSCCSLRKQIMGAEQEKEKSHFEFALQFGYSAYTVDWEDGVTEWLTPSWWGVTKVWLEAMDQS